jgi:hypothetical protein
MNFYLSNNNHLEVTENRSFFIGKYQYIKNLSKINKIEVEKTYLIRFLKLQKWNFYYSKTSTSEHFLIMNNFRSHRVIFARNASLMWTSRYSEQWTLFCGPFCCYNLSIVNRMSNVFWPCSYFRHLFLMQYE